MRKSKAYGPYRRGRKWRLIVIESGARTPVSYPSEAEAIEARDAINKAIAEEEEAASIEEAMTEYLAHKRRIGNSPGGVRTTGYRLRDFFLRAEKPAYTVREVTTSKVTALLDDIRDRKATDTALNTLGEVRTFLGWCVKQGYARRNVARAVKGEGKRSKGKPQLRLTESRKLVQACLSDMSPGAVGVLCALVLGMRASEIIRIQGRDVDDDTLWIPVAKSAAGKRALVVPGFLMTRLRRLVADPTDPIFGDRDRHWLLRECYRLCAVAKVPRVSLHGLRGTHASLVAERGTTGAIVASAMGHESWRTTEAHYAQRQAVDQGRIDQLAQRLEER